MSTDRSARRGPAWWGGISSLYLAGAYVGGILYFLVGIDYPSVVDPLDKIELFAQHLRGLQLAYLAIYVVFGVVLMLLAWTLHDRLVGAARITMRIATSLALVWAGLLIAGGMVMNVGMETVVALHGDDPLGAAALWRAIEAVMTGMTGGHGEVLGGLWTLLVSVAAWRSRALPKALNVVGSLAGVLGILSVLPGFTILIAGFGVTQLLWFVGLGVVLLNTSSGRLRPSAP